MYIREFVTTNKKTGTKYVTHRLVESYQTEKGPRQRIIMHLGTLTLPKSEWRKLACVLEARLAGQESLFSDNPEIAQAANKAMENYSFLQLRQSEAASRQEKRELVSIDLKSVSTTESRSLGPELVAHTIWDRLGFNRLLASCGFSSMQQALAETVVVARLVAPSSDLATWNWLRNETALVELLPVDLKSIGKDAIYEIADKLLLHKDTFEKALRKQEADLFPSDATLFLFDLTNTYFEGRCLKNELAQHAKSKEMRSDCPLVTLALVVDSRGFPIFSQIYDGNQSEPETLEDILDRLYTQGETLFPEALPTIVMDRGIATKENLNLLKDRKYPYIVIERRAVEKEYVQEFQNAKETFDCIDSSSDTQKAISGKPGVTTTQSVYVKKLPTEDGCRVLCLSEGREKKELAIDTLKEQRFLNDLTRLQSSVSKRNIIMIEKVSERVGRLKERYPSIAQHYEIHLELDTEQKKVVALSWDKKPSRIDRLTLTGCYVIETSHKNLSADEIWHLYMTLSQVEDAFRALKTDLGMRPVHHQLANRTKAHLFISVLAYHLLACIEHQLADSKDNRRWSTVRRQLSTHQRTTVILTDEQNQIHHIRVSGLPEQLHQEIYRSLGVKDPLKRNHYLAGKLVVTK